MEFTRRKLEGVIEITLKPHNDNRGFFMRTFDVNIFESAGILQDWVQENHSRSVQKGVIRGLHMQLPPFTETKLVRCIKGSILDVFVDLRQDSSTFGHWDSIELNETNKKLILIPKGFAHGFCTLSDVSEVLYKVDNYYNNQSEVGILWNDQNLDIKWPVTNPILSEKDQMNLTFKQFVNQYKSIKV